MELGLDRETLYRGSVNGREHVSAGGFLLRFVNNTFQTFLLKENSEVDGWNFPRGTMSDEGSITKTVLREVEEETGYKSKILAYLGSVQSTYEVDGRNINKITLYHVLIPLRQVSQQLSEHDEGRWVNIDLVANMLRKVTGRESEHQIWQAFLAWFADQDESELKRSLDIRL